MDFISSAPGDTRNAALKNEYFFLLFKNLCVLRVLGGEKIGD
jgi:hypothetical protein